MMKSKSAALGLVGVVIAMLLAGCTGSSADPSTAPSTPIAAANSLQINICLAGEPETMDPTLNRMVESGVMIDHLYEGLYKWVDGGTEQSTPGDATAVLAPGQIAGEPEITDHDDGTSTWTFTLREDAMWSDGQAVSADDFVYAWRRLVDPALAAPYSYMIDMVENAGAVSRGEMPLSALGVSAPDGHTFVVKLAYSCPYFREICAFPSLMPLREDMISVHPEDWTDVSKYEYISNGPFRLESWTHNAELVMVPNEHYYDQANVGPDSLNFKLMDDAGAMLTAFQNGELDYMQFPPTDEVASLLSSGTLVPGDYLGTYYAGFNNAKAPFDNQKVREAFSLAVDRNYLVETVTQCGEYPAGGWIPYSVYDAAGPDGDDFRTVGGDYISVDPADYEANCQKAQNLLAEAGYPGGENFPPVSYLYNTDERHKAVAEALQSMWKEVLGVDITLNSQDGNVFLQTRAAGDYSICRNGWISDYNDPVSFLDLFMTGNGNNDAHYSNEKYDTLMAEAQRSADAEERMDLMHQAEQLLIGQDYAIMPLYYYTQPYMLNPEINGMYYTPLGVFLFTYCSK